jgi:phosphopantetheinyl transferase
MIWNSGEPEITEYSIRDFLNSLREIYKFEFCLVNLSEVERRLEKKDFSLLSVLSDKELEYFGNLKIKKNKIQWVAGRYAVKSALYKYRMVDPLCVDVLKGEDSAPFILQYPYLCTSITHSFPYCIGIVSENNIGVDIERIEELERSLIEQFFSISEKEILNSLKDTDAYSKKAVMYWTRKEAASKLVKLGMKLDFRKLDTSQDFTGIDDYKIRFESSICNDFYVSIAVEEML